MSLFDYHGRFSRTNETNEDSTVKDDDVNVIIESCEEDVSVESKEMSQISESDTEVLTNSAPASTHAKGAHAKIPAHALVVEDEAEEIEANAAKGEVIRDETKEDLDEADQDQTSEVSDNEELLDASEQQESEANESLDGLNESDGLNEASTTELSDKDENEGVEESANKKAAKKKKTPASKGKHVASNYALPIDEESQEPSSKQTRHILKGIGIAACSVIAVIVLVYGAGVVLFMNRILPNTVVNNYDISFYTNDEAVQLLESIENNYAIEAKMGTFSFRVTRADIGLQVDAPGIIEAIHEKYDAFKWPLYIFDSSHDISDGLEVTFDPAGYQQSFLAAVDEYNKTATPPTDAYIYFDDGAKRFLIKDEIMGTQIDPELSLIALTNAIHNLQPVLRLTEAELVQPNVRGNEEYLIESAKLATSLVSSKISLVVNDEIAREIAYPELSKCISINDNANVSFDENALKELCSIVAQEFNTVGTERTYTRADGKVITVKDGSYGWIIDEEALKESLLDAIKSGESATIVVPFEATAELYKGPGQRDWGNRYIDVDLSEQHVRFYDENGALFWETDCISGSPDGSHNTPQGVWSINDQMASPSKLVGYEGGKKIYETYVTYWMPFIKNSIGFHDATWQPSFGGTMYANGYGSHGCVNLSYDAARELWGLVRVGDVVVTHF